MEPNIIKAQWQNWAGDTVENLVLKKTNEGILVESIIISRGMKDNPTTIRYTLRCDSLWRVQKLNITSVETKEQISLKSDGFGKWFDDLGTTINDLNGAFDVDIEVTPFTNTLPIRRLNLKEKNQTEEILVVYVTVPGLKFFVDRQRYTCLIPNKRYRFEQVDTQFIQDIEVNKYGLVLIYPNLFKRTIT